MSDPRNVMGSGVGGERDKDLDAVAMKGLAGGPGAALETRQPRGLYVLFMVEMWERFSFYGMKALLGVYLVSIIAISQLSPGTYQTRLQFTDKTNQQSASRIQKVMVDQPLADGTPAAQPDAGALRIEPAFDTVLQGPRGGPFSNPQTDYTVTNTSDKPVDYAFTVERDTGDAVYVMINDGTTPVTGTLKPGESVKLKATINTEQSGLSWPKEKAGNLRSLYASSVYFTPIIGGYIADRFLGTSRCLLIGGVIIAAGHFTMMGDSLSTLYVGLLLVVVGTGFFKSNVSTMVGQLFKQGDGRRDAAFTIFYMGINLGAFIGPLLCGWLRIKYGWSWAFGAAGFGMVIGLLQYMYWKPRYLKGIGEATSHSLVAADGNKPLTREEKNRIAVIFIMAFFVVFFWTAFEQASNSMNYFAIERTDRTLPDWLAWTVDPSKLADGTLANIFPAEWFQSVNPLFILLMAPIFASIWVRMASRGREPSSYSKMAIGLITLGLGFLVMVFGALASSGGSVKVSPLWLLAAFFIHTCGELCLSPVGLSLVTKLAPLKFASLMMGTWFLANMAANFIAEQLAGRVDKIAEQGVLGVPGYAGFFLIFVIFPCVAGFVLVFLVPMLKKLAHGRG